MLGALASDGTAVGVLSDSLLKSATSANYRKHLMAGDLALISPFHPEAGFNVGNAMARNRYIYCLADAAVVVNSTLDKGGTWNGALEDLKAAWVPLWVRRNGSTRSGNPELVRRGAHWLGDDLSSLGSVDRRLTGTCRGPAAPRSSAADAGRQSPVRVGTRTRDPRRWGAEEYSCREGAYARTARRTCRQRRAGSGRDGSLQHVPGPARTRSRPTAPLTSSEIARRLGLKKTQANAWLKRGVGEGKIRKTAKPVRYQSTPGGRQQGSLFGDDG